MLLGKYPRKILTPTNLKHFEKTVLLYYSAKICWALWRDNRTQGERCVVSRRGGAGSSAVCCVLCEPRCAGTRHLTLCYSTRALTTLIHRTETKTIDNRLSCYFASHKTEAESLSLLKTIFHFIFPFQCSIISHIMFPCQILKPHI